MKSPEQTIFMADRQGRADLQRAAINQFGSDVRFVFVGDHIDGSSDEAQLLREMQEVYDPEHPNATLGNHEFDRIQAIYAAQKVNDGVDNEFYVAFVDMWARSKSCGKIALESYEVSTAKYRDPVSQTLALYDRMQQEGGLFDFLCDMPLYYEDEKHIAVHAGLTSEPWGQQRRYLDDVKHMLTGRILGIDPPQLYSHELGQQREAFVATDKIVITGHSPTNEDVIGRISADGKRVRLDRPTWDNADKLFVYHGGEQAVLPVYLDATQAA